MEFKNAAMQVICAGFRDRTHLRTPRFLSGHTADLSLKLRQRVGKRQRQRIVVETGDVAGAIQSEFSRRTTRTRARDQQSAGKSLSTTRRSLDTSTTKQQQLLGIAAVQRQLHNSRRFHNLSNANTTR